MAETARVRRTLYDMTIEVDVPEDLLNIGWRPTLAGVATLLVACVAGWGIAQEGSILPVRMVRVWVESVLMPALRHRRWGVRSVVIFANNTVTCALLVTCGRWPGVAWMAIVLVGLSMGIAIRTIGAADLMNPVTLESDGTQPPRGGAAMRLGLLLNMLEVPAIAISLGLSMGRLAAPNGLSSEQIWTVFAMWVVPALAIAATGEGLWLGRMQRR